MRALLSRLVKEERGQDIAEYAMLAAFVGICGLIAWGIIQGVVRDAYIAWDTTDQNNWEPPPPQ